MIISILKAKDKLVMPYLFSAKPQSRYLKISYTLSFIVYVDALSPSLKFSSHVGTISFVLN